MNRLFGSLSRVAGWLAVAAAITTVALLAAAGLADPPHTATALRYVIYPAWTLLILTTVWLGAAWLAQRHTEQATP